MSLQYPQPGKEQSDSDSTSRTVTIRGSVYSNLHLEVAINEDLNDYASKLARSVLAQKEAEEDAEEKERINEMLVDYLIDIGLVALTVCCPPVGAGAWALVGVETVDSLTTLLASGLGEWVTEETIEEVAAFGFEKMMPGAAKWAISFEPKAMVEAYKCMDTFDDDSLVPAEQALLAIHRFKCLVDPAYRAMAQGVEKFREESVLKQQQMERARLGY